jgi:hypothetical protein
MILLLLSVSSCQFQPRTCLDSYPGIGTPKGQTVIISASHYLTDQVNGGHNGTPLVSVCVQSSTFDHNYAYGQKKIIERCYILMYGKEKDTTSRYAGNT